MLLKVDSCSVCSQPPVGGPIAQAESADFSVNGQRISLLGFYTLCRECVTIAVPVPKQLWTIGERVEGFQ